MSKYTPKTDLFSFQIKVWFDDGALCVSDGSRLRPPDADGEGGGVRARRQQHGWRRPGQALVAQESQLWGEMLCQPVEWRLCVKHPSSCFSGSGISCGKDDKLSRCPRDWQSFWKVFLWCRWNIVRRGKRFKCILTREWNKTEESVSRSDSAGLNKQTLKFNSLFLGPSVLDVLRAQVSEQISEAACQRSLSHFPLWSALMLWTRGTLIMQLLFLLQVWFDRRTNYTRSLAVMSMVGYILGLGDRWEVLCYFEQVVRIMRMIVLINKGTVFLFSRHPSNLMLDRLSGKILHIDFGDCFEVRRDFLSICCPLIHFWISLKLTVLRPSTGRHDQREVPWKDPVQTDEDADQRHGGMQLCCWRPQHTQTTNTLQDLNWILSQLLLLHLLCFSQNSN